MTHDFKGALLSFNSTIMNDYAVDGELSKEEQTAIQAALKLAQSDCVMVRKDLAELCAMIKILHEKSGDSVRYIAVMPNKKVLTLAEKFSPEEEVEIKSYLEAAPTPEKVFTESEVLAMIEGMSKSHKTMGGDSALYEVIKGYNTALDELKAKIDVI